MGVKMTVARLGTSLVMELMRLLEGVRGRLSGPDAAAPQGVFEASSASVLVPPCLQFSDFESILCIPFLCLTFIFDYSILLYGVE
jgi:hypothetical protein